MAFGVANYRIGDALLGRLVTMHDVSVCCTDIFPSYFLEILLNVDCVDCGKEDSYASLLQDPFLVNVNFLSFAVRGLPDADLFKLWTVPVR